MVDINFNFSTRISTTEKAISITNKMIFTSVSVLDVNITNHNQGTPTIKYSLLNNEEIFVIETIFLSFPKSNSINSSKI